MMMTWQISRRDAVVVRPANICVGMRAPVFLIPMLRQEMYAHVSFQHPPKALAEIRAAGIGQSNLRLEIAVADRVILR